MANAVKIEGTYKPLNWSDPEPRQNFADKIAAMSNDDFVTEAEKLIWLSAFANNNPHSNWHWMADLCYYEASRRGKPELYERAWKRAAAS